MKKILFLFIFLFTACTSSSSETNNFENVDSNELYSEVTINVNLLNEQTDDYYLFFVKPDVIKYDLTRPKFSDYYGPIEIDGFSVTLDLTEHRGIEMLLEVLDEKKLQVAITTREDYLLRNPLNEETFIYFEENETYQFPKYKSKTEVIKVDIVDKYPDGINSLAFPDAKLAIKLIFAEGVEPTTSYIARIREFSSTSSTGLGIYAPGSPLINKQNYYNAAFSGDHFKGYSGVLEIVDSNNRRVRYEGEPVTIHFDENGVPEQQRMFIKILD